MVATQRLTRTVTVMERLAAAPDDVWSRFARIDDDTGDNTRELRLTLDDWDDLGQPDVLTVTVEPGDRLNGGAP